LGAPKSSLHRGQGDSTEHSRLTQSGPQHPKKFIRVIQDRPRSSLGRFKYRSVHLTEFRHHAAILQSPKGIPSEEKRAKLRAQNVPRAVKECSKSGLRAAMRDMEYGSACGSELPGHAVIFESAEGAPSVVQEHPTECPRFQKSSHESCRSGQAHRKSGLGAPQGWPKSSCEPPKSIGVQLLLKPEGTLRFFDCKKTSQRRPRDTIESPRWSEIGTDAPTVAMGIQVQLRAPQEQP